jgi:hypothetical protein
MNFKPLDFSPDTLDGLWLGVHSRDRQKRVVFPGPCLWTGVYTMPGISIIVDWFIWTLVCFIDQIPA